MTDKPGKKAVELGHLTDTQILAFLDGELAASERQRTAAHLEACWTCRSAMGELQGRIDSFLQARKSALPAPTAFDELRVEQFRQRLARHANQSEAKESWLGSLLTNASAWWQDQLSSSVAFISSHQKAALAVTLSICLVVVMFTDVLTTRVSADTVLRRAENFESSVIPSSGQVVHSSVRVERVDRRSGVTRHLGTLTVIREAQAPITYVSTHSTSGQAVTLELHTADGEMTVLNSLLPKDGLNQPLVDYLAGQHWVPDVSPAGFRTLIEGRASQDSSARRDGSEFELHYPFALGHKSGITEALLRVNAATYAPESISLLTESAQQEYRFTRTSFDLRPRITELASLNIPADISNPVANRTSASAPIRIVPLSYANSKATDTEVLAAQALHKVESCLGEEVYLFPMSDGSLLVQGLVDNAARRDAIRKALHSVPGNVKVEVLLPTEIKSVARLYNPPDQAPSETAASGPSAATLTVTEASLDRIPLYDKVYRHFSHAGADREQADKQVMVFSNQVVTLARQTFLHAWALKRLDREFSAARTSGLSPVTLQQIEEMRRSHRQAVLTLARQQQEMLSQVVDPGIAASAAQLASLQPEKVQPGEDVLLQAREQNDLIRTLFTPSNVPQDADAGLTRLLALLRHLGA